MPAAEGANPARLPISELTLYLQWKVDSKAHERISSMGLRLLDVIARHTLGWHKRAAPLSLTLLAAGSGLHRQRVPSLLRELECAGLVLVERPSGAQLRGHRPSTITVVVPIEDHVKYQQGMPEGHATAAVATPGTQDSGDLPAEPFLLTEAENREEVENAGGPVADHPRSAERTRLVR